MQVDWPCDVTLLRAPGAKRLKLTYDQPRSNLAFHFNCAATVWETTTPPPPPPATCDPATEYRYSASSNYCLKKSSAGSYCKGKAVLVEPMKPMLKAPGTKRLKLTYNNTASILSQFCFNSASILLPVRTAATPRRPGRKAAAQS